MTTATSRSPEHAFKMGAGQIRGALARATPEERESLLRQLSEEFAPPVFPVQAEPEEETAEAPRPVVAEDNPIHATADGVQYVDHSSLRKQLEARKATLNEQVNRSTNERQIMIWSAEIKTIDWAIERSLEADRIPAEMVKYGNDGVAKGLVIHTCDMLDTPRPLIKFNLYRFQTDRPFRIACLRWYTKNRKKGDPAIFEVPLDHEAYCDLNGHFQGFAPADHVAELVNKGRAKRPSA